MAKFRKSVCLDLTITVPDDGSSDEAQEVAARSAIELAAPHYLDGCEINDCYIAGCNVTSIENY